MCQDPGTRNCSKSGMHPEAAVLSPITQQYDILDYTLYTEIHRSKQIQTVKSEFILSWFKTHKFYYMFYTSIAR